MMNKQLLSSHRQSTLWVDYSIWQNCNKTCLIKFGIDQMSLMFMKLVHKFVSAKSFLIIKFSPIIMNAITKWTRAHVLCWELRRNSISKFSKNWINNNYEQKFCAVNLLTDNFFNVAESFSLENTNDRLFVRLLKKNFFQKKCSRFITCISMDYSIESFVIFCGEIIEIFKHFEWSERFKAFSCWNTRKLGWLWSIINKVE